MLDFRDMPAEAACPPGIVEITAATTSDLVAEGNRVIIVAERGVFIATIGCLPAAGKYQDRIPPE
ncbi:MAG: hypothetical protein ACRDHG_03030 [Anaerolineales bacterium]